MRIIKNNAVDRIPLSRTAGMMTQHKKFSSEIVTRHFKHVCASSKKNAVDRIPSPRTAGMMTQHKKSLLKLLRGIFNTCAHHPNKMQWIQRNAGMLTQHKFSSEIVTWHFPHVCASEILLVTLFVKPGTSEQLCNRDFL